MKNFDISPNYINIPKQNSTPKSHTPSFDISKLLQTIKDLNIDKFFGNKNNDTRNLTQNPSPIYNITTHQSFMQQENFKLAKKSIENHNLNVKRLRKD